MANRIFLTEIGNSGTKWSQGSPQLPQDEFLTALQGIKGIKIYQEMADNDPIVTAILHAIKQVLREVRWSVKSSSSDPNTEDENVAFLKENMRSMDHSWSDFMSDVYSIFTYGWALFEEVYALRNGKIWWKKLAHRSQGSLYAWELGEHKNVVGMWQGIDSRVEKVYIPFSKCLHFVTEHKSGNPEGYSLLRGAYRPYYFKKNLEEIEAIGAEKDLVGMPELTPPEGFSMDDEKAETAAALTWAKNILTNVRRDEQDGLFLPFGWNFRLVPSPGQRAFNVNEIIDRKSKEIALTVLAQFIMLGMERTGSYALAKELIDMFYMSLESWADYIATVINRQGVTRLFALNGITNDVPYIVHTSVRRQDLRDITYFVSNLFDSSKITLSAELTSYLERYGRLHEFSEIRP